MRTGGVHTYTHILFLYFFTHLEQDFQVVVSALGLAVQDVWQDGNDYTAVCQSQFSFSVPGSVKLWGKQPHRNWKKGKCLALLLRTVYNVLGLSPSTTLICANFAKRTLLHVSEAIAAEWLYCMPQRSSKGGVGGNSCLKEKSTRFSYLYNFWWGYILC